MRDNKIPSLEFVSEVIFPSLAEELSSLISLLKARQKDRLYMLRLYEVFCKFQTIPRDFSSTPHHNLIDIKRNKF